MSIRDLREKLEAEIADAKLKVETIYVELVEAGNETKGDLQERYADSVVELYAKLAEARDAARSFASRYGKKIVIGGAIVVAILAAGYLSGFFAV